MLRMSGLRSHLNFVVAVAAAAAPAATAVLWGVAEAEAQWVIDCEVYDPVAEGCCLCYVLDAGDPWLPSILACMEGAFYGQTVCDPSWEQCPTVNDCVALP